jgi:hypothetical protein
VATDMQDDLRKMIERLIKQKRGPIRKGPIKRKGVTDPRPTETEKGGRRRRPRPMPKPMPSPEGNKRIRPRPMPMPRGPRGDGPKPRPMPKAPGLPRKPRKRI